MRLPTQSLRLPDRKRCLMQVDRSSFTQAQWQAIAVYVEARKRKRRFLIKAGGAAVLGCSAALMSHSMMKDGTLDIPASLHWVQVALPVLLLIVLGIGAAAVHGGVAASRTDLTRSGVPKELVADFEKYPTSKL